MVRRYTRAYVEAIHYFKTRKEETIKIISKYSRVEDRNVLEHSLVLVHAKHAGEPLPSAGGLPSSAAGNGVDQS